MWSPPHLDKYFIELCDSLLKQKHTELIYEQSVFDDRFSDEFQEMIEDNNKLFNQFNNKDIIR